MNIVNHITKKLSIKNLIKFSNSLKKSNLKFNSHKQDEQTKGEKLAKLLALLKDKKLKITKTRVTMLKKIITINQPFSVKQLMRQTNASFTLQPTHKATFYRDLKTLVKLKVVKEVALAQSKQVLYQLVLQQTNPNYLFHCQRCQNTYPLNQKLLVKSYFQKHAFNKALANLKYKIESIDIKIEGLCSRCH